MDMLLLWIVISTIIGLFTFLNMLVDSIGHDKFFYNGFQVKHLFLMLILPGVIILSLIMLILLAFSTLFDKIKPILNKRIF